MIGDDVQAIRDRFLDTVEAELPDMIIVMDNQSNEDIPVDKPWCRFNIRPSDNNLIQIGEVRKYAQLGLAITQIVIPPETGDYEGYRIASVIDEAFKDWRSDDRSTRVYKTSYDVTPSNDTDPNFIIRHWIYWKSIRAG